MENQPSLETVYQALQALYNNPDAIGKEKASVWLGELQKSVFAWQIADQLLQQNQSLESCYFAAQTMRTKIQYAFHELPVDSHVSLRDSLLNHGKKITSSTDAAIVTQLSLALADLTLQMASWKGAALDLINKFGNSSDQLQFLLEVLQVLPEEINSRSLRLGANRRNELIDEFRNSAAVVLQLLMACCENFGDDQRIRCKVYRCLGSWFSVGAIPEDVIMKTNLLSLPFQSLSQAECSTNLHEAASDCICNAFYSIEDVTKFSALSQTLVQGVLALVDMYHLAVAQEDFDKVMNYCRVFADMGESFLHVIVTTPNQGFGDFRILELLLTCIGHHSYEVAEICFNFWYRLSEELYHVNSEELNSVFKSYITRLIFALCRHCQMDPDTETIEESSDFLEFRKRVTELVKDVIFIVGSSSCFKQMFELLHSQPTSASWDESEAALFIMGAVAKNILPDESEIVPQVVESILALQTNCHLIVKHTSIHLLGELCEWIEAHPHVLDSVLQFLLSGLQQPELASVSATALQNIATQCRDRMIQHFEGLLQITKAMDTFNLSKDAAIGLLKGTATILARLPHEKIIEYLQQLCSYQLQPLAKLLNVDTPPKKDGSPNDPVIWLDRLAAIFRHTTPTVTNGSSHPCQPVIEEVWPVLSQACKKYQSDIRIIERCCRCIRFAIRSLGKNSTALITPLVTQMVSIYAQHPHSCFLYLGSILVDEYGMEEGCIQGLLDMLQAFCVPTFKLLDEPNGFRNHPDTVDDLFRLCLRFIQRAPVAYLQSLMCKPVLRCAIVACSIDHREANTSVMKYIIDMIRCGSMKEDKNDFETRQNLISEILEESGATLVHALLTACLFSLPTYMFADAGEVLFELMNYNRPKFCVWLETSLKSLPSHTTGGAITVTHKQLTDFHKVATMSENLKQVTSAIKDFSRLYR